MRSVLLVYRRRVDVVRPFEFIAGEWELSGPEAAAVAGTSMPSGRRLSRSRPSDFVLERMALAVEIDALLAGLMARAEIPDWLRRSVPGVFDACPLEDMFGSSDRMRRIRAMLEVEISQ